MTPYRIASLAGDGIGPEVVAAARIALDATGVPLVYEDAPVGWACFEECGRALPEETVELARACDATFLGAVTSKPPDEIAEIAEGGASFRSPIVGLRQALDLHTCVRPIRSLAEGGLDLVVVRENTEGLYAGLDFHPVPAPVASALGLSVDGAEAALTVRLVTRRAVERVARAAFELAARRPRRSLTLAEKPSVMRASGGLFLETVRAVATEYRRVSFAWENADAVCMRLVREPARYDVLLAGNLFGDLLSDLGAGLAGGLGFLPSANVGDAHALFEPAHGSAPDIAGTGRANPIAAILAGAMLLDHLGERAAARRLERAVEAVVREGRVRTPDIGGRSSTLDVARAIASAVPVLEGRPI